MMLQIQQFPRAVLSLIAISISGLVTTSVIHAQQRVAKAPLADAGRGFAVVELFTSEGCSSCPPADANLAAITEQAEREGKNIITLSFHVDYWNYLGWKDPYSTATATKRQRLYAGVHGSKQVYTPQMVVNGTKELLGSNREKSKAAILLALKKQPRSSLQLTTKTEGQTVTAHWKIDRLEVNDLVNLALVQQYTEEQVAAGENGGRKLRHVNVVRDFQVANPAKEEGSIALAIPTGVDAKGLHVVAYLQSSNDADIHAVAVSELATN